MRFRWALLLFPALLAAEDWKSVRIGPFEVLSTSEKDGREALNHLEQLRHTLSGMLGRQDLQTAWPIRILIGRNLRQPKLQLRRDALMAGTPKLEPETVRDVATVLIDDNTGHFPEPLRRGLAQLLSTLIVDGTHITMGTPPAQKDRDWTRAHMLAVSPDYSGKLRVLLSNLEKGIDAEVAYKNAFEKSPAEIEAAVNEYAAAAQYGTVPVSARPLDARRQLLPKAVDDETAALALADLNGNYEALLAKNPELVAAHEGLGLSGKRQHLEKAAALNSTNARVYFALGQFAKAASLNKRWPDPLLMQAQQEPEAVRKAPLLKAATQLDARNGAAWVALAAAQEQLNQFADAAKSWAAAERASSDPVERDRVRAARIASEQRRVDKEIAERDAARRKAEQEIQDLRNKSLAEIRAFEARANAGQRPLDEKIKIVEWDDINQPAAKVQGVLTRVDCLGEQAKLHVTHGKKTEQFLVKDASRIILTGGGQRSLRCGPQRPPAAVTIEHQNNVAVTIEFR